MWQCLEHYGNILHFTTLLHLIYLCGWSYLPRRWNTTRGWI